MTTHQEQMLVDLRAIFTTSEYGRAAEITPGEGAAISTTVLVNPEQGMVQDAQGQNPADTTMIHALTADYSLPAYGDKIRLTATATAPEETYDVERIARRSIGRTVLACIRNGGISLK